MWFLVHQFILSSVAVANPDANTLLRILADSNQESHSYTVTWSLSGLDLKDSKGSDVRLANNCTNLPEQPFGTHWFISKRDSLLDSPKLQTDIKALNQWMNEQCTVDYRLELSAQTVEVVMTESKKEKMSQAGIDFSTIDLKKWISLQSLLKVQNIPAGTFTMGCTSKQGSDCDDNEKPSHKVTISKDFYMMESEVTQALWESVMGSNPSKFKGANRPVEQVSWIEAATFANRLSELDGRASCYSISGNNVKWSNKDCTGWRLPTEAEWEYAARGGQSYKYAGSDNVDEVAWYYKNSGAENHPVGQKKPNGFGLYDMSGNVWEWVWDRYGDYSSGNQTDPTGPDSGSSRVLRGGYWSGAPDYMRASYRGGSVPAARSSSIGFRLGHNP